MFITGASPGPGKATAKLFHAIGWKVISTMPIPKKEPKLSQLGNVTFLTSNVTKAKQITAGFHLCPGLKTEVRM